MSPAWLNEFIEFARSIYGTSGDIPLHAPVFAGREKEFVTDCVDTTMVSSIGAYVRDFEAALCDYTGAGGVVAVVNGTAALHVAMKAAGVTPGSLVLTQPLTFVATSAAISYLGAEPIFVDIDEDTLSLSPRALSAYLEEHASRTTGSTLHRGTGRPITACVPVHTFGYPGRIDEIVAICADWGIPVVEDAAAGLGSRFDGRHVGTQGAYGILSFNGNKIITCGGGGAVLCPNMEQAEYVRHLTTTAKCPHPWRFYHDEAGFNYRMPNINAALGYAQLEYLDLILQDKEQLAELYATFFADHDDVACYRAPSGAAPNYWLNLIILKNAAQRDAILDTLVQEGIFCRPAWEPMHRLPMFAAAERGPLTVCEAVYPRIISLPSSARGENVRRLLASRVQRESPPSRSFPAQ